jgi:hypothetical protein
LAATLAVATAVQVLPVGLDVDGGETVKVTWFDPPAAGNERDWLAVFGAVGRPAQLMSTLAVAPAGIAPNGRTATPMFAGPEPDEAPGRPATAPLVAPGLLLVEAVEVPVDRLRQRNSEPDFEQISFVVFLPSSDFVQSPLSLAVEAFAGAAKLRVAVPRVRAAKAATVTFVFDEMRRLGEVRRVRWWDNAGNVIEYGPFGRALIGV